jgi:pimeloyl-ACP methyl ester carboxylesterase
MARSRIVIALLATIAFLSEHVSSQTTAAIAGQSVRVNGFEMYYEIHGTGEPLVLLHGITQSSATWAPVIPHETQDYRVIVPDLRGHGRSTNPSKEFTHRQAARDVFALLDELDIHSFKAMGISTGGMTLLHMATSKPERVEAMVLIGAASYFPEQARKAMLRQNPESMSEERWALMRRRHFSDEQILMLQSHFYGFKDSYEDMNFTRPLLSTITARTLIIYGDRDDFFPVEIATEIYDAIPRSYLWVVPNGTHIPIFGDTLPFFVKTTREFLRGDWKRK